MTRRLVGLWALFLMASIVAVAPTAAAAVHEVRIVSSAKFEPASIEIAAGDTVKWIAEQNGHTVTSDADGQAPWEADGRFDKSVSTTSPYEHTFSEPGTVHYFCRPHSGFMHGSVTVTGSASSPSVSPSTSSSPSFNDSTEDDTADTDEGGQDDGDATTEGTPSLSGAVVVAVAALVALLRGRRWR